MAKVPEYGSHRFLTRNAQRGKHDCLQEEQDFHVVQGIVNSAPAPAPSSSTVEQESPVEHRVSPIKESLETEVWPRA